MPRALLLRRAPAHPAAVKSPTSLSPSGRTILSAAEAARPRRAGRLLRADGQCCAGPGARGEKVAAGVVSRPHGRQPGEPGRDVGRALWRGHRPSSAWRLGRAGRRRQLGRAAGVRRIGALDRSPDTGFSHQTYGRPRLSFQWVCSDAFRGSTLRPSTPSRASRAHAGAPIRGVPRRDGDKADPLQGRTRRRRARMENRLSSLSYRETRRCFCGDL